MSTVDLIPADLRACLRGLNLVARRMTAGDGVGQHAGAARGAGLEFAQYRSYEPGDDVRRIDWKLYARSDRFFVREAERDSPLTVWVVIDATASMRQADRTRADYCKLDAARTFAACVIELATRQNDRFGIIALGGAAPAPLVAAAGTRHRDRCAIELGRLQASGRWPETDALPLLWERIAPTSLVVMLSDFFDDAAAEFAARLAAARREVLTVQLLTADERDFSFAGSHRLRDPESAAERRVDAAAVRDDFVTRFGAARETLRMRFAAAGVRHVEYVLDEPLSAPLAQFFAPRRSR